MNKEQCFECDFCDYTSNSKGSLQKHISDNHSGMLRKAGSGITSSEQPSSTERIRPIDVLLQSLPRNVDETSCIIREDQEACNLETRQTSESIDEDDSESDIKPCIIKLPLIAPSVGQNEACSLSSLDIISSATIKRSEDDLDRGAKSVVHSVFSSESSPFPLICVENSAVQNAFDRGSPVFPGQLINHVENVIKKEPNTTLSQLSNDDPVSGKTNFGNHDVVGKPSCSKNLSSDGVSDKGFVLDYSLRKHLRLPHRYQKSSCATATSDIRTKACNHRLACSNVNDSAEIDCTNVKTEYSEEPPLIEQSDREIRQAEPANMVLTEPGYSTSDDGDDVVTGSGNCEDSEHGVDKQKHHNRKEKSVMCEDSYAFNPGQRGTFTCWICSQNFPYCLNVKIHILQQHAVEALCALTQFKPGKSDAQVQLLLFCPRSCNFVTSNISAFSHHMVTCQEPELETDGQDFLTVQTNFVLMEYNKLKRRLTSGVIKGVAKRRKYSSATRKNKRMPQDSSYDMLSLHENTSSDDFHEDYLGDGHTEDFGNPSKQREHWSGTTEHDDEQEVNEMDEDENGFLRTAPLHFQSSHMVDPTEEMSRSFKSKNEINRDYYHRLKTERPKKYEEKLKRQAQISKTNRAKLKDPANEEKLRESRRKGLIRTREYRKRQKERKALTSSRDICTVMMSQSEIALGLKKEQEKLRKRKERESWSDEKLDAEREKAKIRYLKKKGLRKDMIEAAMFETEDQEFDKELPIGQSSTAF